MERTPNYRFATEKPDHIMVSISGDARYSITVTWRASSQVNNGYVEYGKTKIKVFINKKKQNFI